MLALEKAKDLTERFMAVCKVPVNMRCRLFPETQVLLTELDIISGKLLDEEELSAFIGYWKDSHYIESYNQFQDFVTKFNGGAEEEAQNQLLDLFIYDARAHTMSVIEVIVDDFKKAIAAYKEAQKRSFSPSDP